MDGGLISCGKAPALFNEIKRRKPKPRRLVIVSRRSGSGIKILEND
jgi:hypothetical protein